MRATGSNPTDPSAVDPPLPEVGALCVDLSRWHDAFRRGEHDASVLGLDVLLTRVRALPTVAGLLGDALGLLEAGGLDDADATVAAFAVINEAAERYREAVALHLVDTRRPARADSQRGRPVQQPLFGNDYPAGESAT